MAIKGSQSARRLRQANGSIDQTVVSENFWFKIKNFLKLAGNRGLFDLVLENCSKRKTVLWRRNFLAKDFYIDVDLQDFEVSAWESKTEIHAEVRSLNLNIALFSNEKPRKFKRFTVGIAGEESVR